MTFLKLLYFSIPLGGNGMIIYHVLISAGIDAHILIVNIIISARLVGVLVRSLIRRKFEDKRCTVGQSQPQDLFVVKTGEELAHASEDMLMRRE